MLSRSVVAIRVVMHSSPADPRTLGDILSSCLAKLPQTTLWPPFNLAICPHNSTPGREFPIKTFHSQRCLSHASSSIPSARTQPARFQLARKKEDELPTRRHALVKRSSPIPYPVRRLPSSTETAGRTYTETKMPINLRRKQRQTEPGLE
ncbi:hypothetical protein E4U53_004609, partial [Claviceps sorghi]